MIRERGLRERKKAQTRDRLADVAARLFAERGYDDVSIMDVARAADVSDQTVYNYFATKQDLVLDRADEFVERYRHSIVERLAGTSPASALRVLVDEDIDRYRGADLGIARGEFPAQCVASAVLRRYALEFRERQVDAIADAILATDPRVLPIIAKTHAAALVSVVQSITDDIGKQILIGNVTDLAAAAMAHEATVAFDALDRYFHFLIAETT